MQSQRREKGKNEGRVERANGTKEKREGSFFTVEMGKGTEKEARNFNCYQETRREQHMRSVVRVRIWPDLRATAPLRWCLFLSSQLRSKTGRTAQKRFQIHGRTPGSFYASARRPFSLCSCRSSAGLSRLRVPINVIPGQPFLATVLLCNYLHITREKYV